MSEHPATFDSCPPVADLLLAVEGELPAPECDALTAHLRSCPACRVRVDEVERALDVFAISRIREAEEVTLAHPSSDSRRSIRRWMTLAAMIALIVGVFVAQTQTVLGAKGLLQRVQQIVRQTFGFADARPKTVQQPPPVEKRTLEGAPAIVEPVLPSDPAPSVAPRPVSPAVTPPRRRLERLIHRLFVNRETGREQVADLPRRAASVTRLLNELSKIGKLDSATGDGHVASQRVENEKRALKLYGGLRRDLGAVEEILHLIFGGIKIRSLASDELPADWPRRASEALPQSMRLERLIDELLAHDDLLPDGAKSTREHPIYARIEPTLAALWETVNGVP